MVEGFVPHATGAGSVKKVTKRRGVRGMIDENEELRKWIEADTEEVNDICKKYQCIPRPRPVVLQYYDDLVGCL